MQISLPLNEMTKEEKLRVMETLWTDLTKSEEEFISPGWHEDVLKAREERIKSGREGYKDWEVAKKELRNRLL
jgi:hypothetical protein